MNLRPLMFLAVLAAATLAHAAEKAAPGLPPNMTTYFFCLLTKGPNSGAGTPEERQKIQAAHLANITRLHGAGKLLVAGPFMDNGNWRGLFIFKCATLEEAQALAASDPAVQAGRLAVEIHPWLTQQGNILDPEFPVPPAAAKP
ncbi:MAG: hypothetical protein HZA93_11445 [Verrucomicrobia bacterium]|nr:hypothetical protein [Verrucomicrobiota bacterium]